MQAQPRPVPPRRIIQAILPGLVLMLFLALLPPILAFIMRLAVSAAAPALMPLPWLLHF